MSTNIIQFPKPYRPHTPPVATAKQTCMAELLAEMEGMLREAHQQAVVNVAKNPNS